MLKPLYASNFNTENTKAHTEYRREILKKFKAQCTKSTIVATFLWIFASSILLFLGTIHLYYTLFSNRFSIRDVEVEQGMKNAFPVLTNKTTVWKAWIGFNASHSLCGIYIGLINIVLAFSYYDMLRQSLSVRALTLGSSLFLLYLGKKYWFRIPFAGILVSCICYGIALFLM